VALDAPPAAQIGRFVARLVPAWQPSRYDAVIMRRITGAQVLAVALLALGLYACKGKEAGSLETMYLWAKALQMHIATDMAGGYTMPESLDRLDPAVTAGFPREDAWGHALVYRRITDDHYQLISAGPDGTPGNSDDLVIENGTLKNADQVYAARPLR
jgi:hypothetical protein